VRGENEAGTPAQFGRGGGPVEVHRPLDGREFVAVFVDPVHRADDSILEIELTDLGDGVWALETSARKGLFEIELVGYGPEGDVYVVFTADIVDQPDLRAPAPFFSFLA
jgi:hypothetical protein